MILIGLRLLGKRGVKQLSIFELVAIISLGSAAGDPMFYKEVGLLIPFVVFCVIVGAYKFTTYWMTKNNRLDDLVEGKATYLIRDGEFNIQDFRKENLPQDAFFSEMRQQSVSHLGQVKTAILETSGNVSLYFYPDDEVKYGLPILPDLFEKCSRDIHSHGTYACAFCGNIQDFHVPGKYQCDKCGKYLWINAINNKRIH
jgi:uncharacterized membrane protein YcaP (DUF421 family)